MHVLEKIIYGRTSQMVQWLRICLPMQRAQVQSLVRELKSHMPPGTWNLCSLTRESPSTTTKTQHSQKKKKKKMVYTIESSIAHKMFSFMPFFIKYILPGSVLSGWERPMNKAKILLPSSLQSGELANWGLLCHGRNTKPKRSGIARGIANPLFEN